MTSTQTNVNPKPRKPLFRLRNVLLFFVLILFATGGYSVFETMRVMNGEPNPQTDYRAQHRALIVQHLGYDEDQVIEAEKAWILLLELLDETSDIIDTMNAEIEATDPEPRWEWDGPFVDFSMVRDHPMPENLDREREAIRRLREAGIFDKAARFSRVAPALDNQQVTGMLILINLPELSSARSFATTCLASARFALEDGNLTEAAAAYRELLAVAQTLGHQNTVISWLVCVAIDMLMVNELRAALNEYSFDERSLQSIFDSITRFDIPPVSLALEGERATILDTVQWTFSDDGDGDGYLVPKLLLQVTASSPATELGTVVGAFISRFYLATRKETVESTNQLMDEIIAIGETPRSQRAPAADAFEISLSAIEDDRKHFIISLLMPAMSAVVDSDHIARVVFDGTRIMVGIELFRARNGRYPDTLNELMPDIFNILPTDFTHGGQFGYRKLEQPDEQGREYLLYSTGLDETDDGGKQVDWKNPPIGTGQSLDLFSALKDEDAAGYDYLINQTREELTPNY